MQNTTVLVTGGTGFVGIHTIFQLLLQEYNVRTTLRSLSRKDEITQALTAGGINSFENLSFYEAELTSDVGWNDAVKGCDYVLHVASPFPLAEPKDENDLIIPARDGALRVLRASRDAGVRRVVLTSSFAAIGYGTRKQNHVYTENDWTDETAPIMAYLKSKTIAEKAAWKFIQQEGGAMELTVINPVGIFGPALGSIKSASIEGVIETIIHGHIKESPPFSFGAVDVRDVADIHIQAMLHPKANNERFLATSDGCLTFYDVAELIKQKRPERAEKIGAITPTPAEFYTAISNQKAKRLLHWNPRSKEEAVLASVDSLPG